MSDPNKLQAGEPGEQRAKRPYVKPAIRLERVFETMALACGKVVATQQACKTNRRNS